MVLLKDIQPRHANTRLLVAVAALLLASCSTPDQPQVFPDVTFEHLQPLQVDAARVDINMRYTPPRQPPNVEHLSPLTFESAINTWVSRRFATDVSSANHMVLTVKESSISEEPLPLDTGLSGALKKEQEFEYTSVLDLQLQLISPNGTALADFTSRVWQKRTVTEGLSQYERRMIWLQMVEAAVNEADRQLQPRLRENLSEYIRF